MPQFGSVSPFLVRKGYQRTVISTAQLKNAFTTAITIVPIIPGFIGLLNYLTVNKPIGTAYNLNGNSLLNIRQMSSALALNQTIGAIALGSFIDVTGATFFVFRKMTDQSFFQDNNAVGGYIELKLDVANMTIGDAPLEVCAIFDIMPSNFIFNA